MTKIRVTLKVVTRLVIFWLINLHVAPENKNKSTIIRKQNKIIIIIIIIIVIIIINIYVAPILFSAKRICIKG